MMKKYMAATFATILAGTLAASAQMGGMGGGMGGGMNGGMGGMNGGMGGGMGMSQPMSQMGASRRLGGIDTQTTLNMATGIAQQLTQLLKLDAKQAQKVKSAYYSQMRKEVASGVNILLMPGGEFARRGDEGESASHDEADLGMQGGQGMPQGGMGMPPQGNIQGMRDMPSDDMAAGTEQSNAKSETTDIVKQMDARHTALEKKLKKILTAEQMQRWQQSETEQMKAYFRKI